MANHKKSEKRFRRIAALHEAGHALAAFAAGYEVTAIDIEHSAPTSIPTLLPSAEAGFTEMNGGESLARIVLDGAPLPEDLARQAFVLAGGIAAERIVCRDSWLQLWLTHGRGDLEKLGERISPFAASGPAEFAAGKFMRKYRNDLAWLASLVEMNGRVEFSRGNVFRHISGPDWDKLGKAMIRRKALREQRAHT